MLKRCGKQAQSASALLLRYVRLSLISQHEACIVKSSARTLSTNDWKQIAQVATWPPCHVEEWCFADAVSALVPSRTTVHVHRHARLSLYLRSRDFARTTTMDAATAPDVQSAQPEPSTPSHLPTASIVSQAAEQDSHPPQLSDRARGPSPTPVSSPVDSSQNNMDAGGGEQATVDGQSEAASGEFQGAPMVVAAGVETGKDAQVCCPVCASCLCLPYLHTSLMVSRPLHRLPQIAPRSAERMLERSRLRQLVCFPRWPQVISPSARTDTL